MFFKWFRRRETRDDYTNTEKNTGTNVTQDIQKNHFNRMIKMANALIENSKCHEETVGYRHPILNYIKLLGLKLQTSYITNLVYDDDHGDEKKFPNITPWLLFFDLSVKISSDVGTMYDLIYKNKLNKEIEIELAKDLILPWPWNDQRYIRSISSIGVSRPWGEWKEHTSNHNTYVLLPIGVCIVVGGNHSITSGILQGEGTLKTDNVYDMSDLYNYVYTDGRHYKRIKDESLISEVSNVEFAAIFEIGRIMMNLGISR
ncbi:hypothetical protein BSK48_30665 [Paenibacillus odorifer]|uniref:DUF6710 family protein n=1 Tax=Paenibacillus odorifer TaxID=189426 RepID=UPI00096E058D|nr:DUF6710 family protein [Paenibacillus odorifer]OMD58163.1 hypothetical protein BSK48_30665 [Paenibacillus odorifer]